MAEVAVAEAEPAAVGLPEVPVTVVLVGSCLITAAGERDVAQVLA